MSLPAQEHRYSIQEYYRIENDATEKHEFRDGEILAMSGGSPQHALIAVNVSGELRNRLKGKSCQPYSSDLRVRMVGEEYSVYPDIMVICGPVQYDPDDKARHTILNPRVIVEILSLSTEGYDRGDKFAAYRNIPSLTEYVLVSQKEARMETFFRQADHTWSLASFSGLEVSAKLRSIDIELPLAEVYASVEFPTKPDTETPAIVV